jgi:hypothetical protein
MSSFTRAARRGTAAAALALSTALALGGVASATQETHTSSNPANQSPQPASNADYTGHGANTHGSYDSTRDGSPSENGKGDGQANGKPCAGCVGKADNKNPKGQYPDGTDHNAGYECDRNQGIGQTNPAHTGCTTADTSVAGNDQPRGEPRGDPRSAGRHGDPGKPPFRCPGGTMATDVNHDGVIDAKDCSAPTQDTRAAEQEQPAQPSPAHDCTAVGGSMSGPCDGAAVAGSATGADTRVLGVSFVRPPQDPSAPSGGAVHVLGAALARGVTALPFAGDLPLTGTGLVAWFLVALVLMAAGAVLLRASGGEPTR